MSYLPYDVYLNQQHEKQRLQVALQKAEMARLLREAGLDQRGGFSGLSGWLLSQLGHVLVMWGERLERCEASPQGQPLRHQAI